MAGAQVEPDLGRGSSIWAKSCRDVGGERQAAATTYGRESCEEENEAGGGRGGCADGRGERGLEWHGGLERAAAACSWWKTRKGERRVRRR